MKYSDIVGLQDYFQPVYNLERESHGYWKQFIANDQFYDILKTTLDALTLEDPKHNKSLWVQGAYGTGKSHASAVIKHLLWDDIDTIDDYLQSQSFGNIQLAGRINNYRQENKILPIVLSGSGGVTNHRTMALQIERAVKETLKLNEIAVKTQSDFERMIDKTGHDDYLYWDKIIKENQELNMIVEDRDDIAEKLRTNDIDLLCTLENIFNKKGHHFSHEKIAKWLTEVSEEIVNRGAASGMMIFWDEFTPLLELDNTSGILEQVQDIAELSRNKKIFLYLISHRDPEQAGLIREDIEKIRGRFHDKKYSMEPITTYHIIWASIKRNNAKWSGQQQKVYDKYLELETLIDHIAKDQNISIKGKIRDLYPIHPYSAYLSTFISRNLGSTNRSIFNFLYDEEKGYAKFITDEIKDNLLLTADYLWDFFFEEFKDAKFSQALEKFRLYEKKLLEKGDFYLRVFKGILLLNVLYRVIETGSTSNHLVNPSQENIKFLFLGSGIEFGVEEVLDYLDKNEIIQRNPDDLFLVSFTDLPLKEVEEERKKIKAQYKDVVEAIKLDPLKKNFESIFEIVLREKEVGFFSGTSDTEPVLRNKMSKAFKLNYSLHIAVFLLLKEQEEEKTVQTILKMSKETEYNNVIFMVLEEPLGEISYSRFIEFLARSGVSRNHNYNEEASSLEDNAKKIISKWLAIIKERYSRLFFRKIKRKYLVSKIGEAINNEYSPSIFHSGIDIIDDIKKYATIWPQRSRVKLDEFFSATSRTYIEEKTKPANLKPLRALLKDKNGEYIVDENLNFKDDFRSFYPLSHMVSEIEKTFNQIRKRPAFNLGIEFEFLTKPPFGIYHNMPNMALFGFIMRQYNGELYEIGSGRIIENSLMKDKIFDMFNSWEKNKHNEGLNVRFGSEEERELIALLKDIFGLQDVVSLTNTRWKIGEYIKKAGSPIWSLKYCSKAETINRFCDEIFKLTRSIDTEIKREDMGALRDLIEKNIFDIKALIKDNKSFKSGFTAFLMGIEKTNVAEHEVKELIEYLVENLQEEVFTWEEDKVKLKVLHWRLEKTQNEPQEPPSGLPDTGSPSPGEPPFPGTTGSEQEASMKRAIQKIESYNGSLNSIKQILIKMIEGNPNISKIFERFFDRGKNDNL
ncbi:MAG: hypothetical protein PVH61_08570 [Candidatus Aminicenantes bacterium]|jgi:hypothetical protein